MCYMCILYKYSSYMHAYRHCTGYTISSTTYISNIHPKSMVVPFPCPVSMWHCAFPWAFPWACTSMGMFKGIFMRISMGNAQCHWAFPCPVSHCWSLCQVAFLNRGLLKRLLAHPMKDGTPRCSVSHSMNNKGTYANNTPNID